MLNIARKIVEALTDPENFACFSGSYDLVHYQYENGLWMPCNEIEGEYSMLVNLADVEFDYGQNLRTLDFKADSEIEFNPVPTSLITYAKLRAVRVSIESVADAYIAGEVSFFRKEIDGLWHKCGETLSEWMSLQSGETERNLSLGYPIGVIKAELSRRHRLYEGKTPDMCVSASDFMSFYVDGMILIESHSSFDDWGSGMGRQTLFREIKLGENHYSMSFESHTDVESSGSSEEWARNNLSHRISGPALVKKYVPYIPDEGYLAEHTENWFLDGVEKEHHDLTDHIIERWPLSQQQAFGYNV
tara:strand:- start:678 stop:1586 length:909 start_codon:yes stop_codon:yes gene_type:complete